MQTEPTTAQLIANRLNALKSTGPKTEDGKANTRFNARRHGMTGQFYCMSEADEIAYKAYEADMFRSLRPEGAYETQLAISITQDHWRINRSRSIEFNIIGKRHDDFAADTIAPSDAIQTASTQAQTFLSTDRIFANLALYETRLRRLITQNENRLRELQAERRVAEAEARKEAELLVHLALMKREKLDKEIESNGFVFSTLELTSRINRQARVQEAKFYESNKWNGRIPYSNPTPPANIAA